MRTIEKRRLLRRGWAVTVLAIVVGTSVPALAQQTFDSGSTGADGALDLSSAAPNSTVDFNPIALGIDQDHDNVFHFTTITIPANVTLRLSAQWTTGPVYWLASGAVVINGIVNLSGGQGHAETRLPWERKPSIPGPGGFPGGIGGTSSAEFGHAATAGGGPRNTVAIAANNVTADKYGGNAPCSRYIVPLLGGGGGFGYTRSEYEYYGAGGGAGGGAILIASSASITIGGQILANGGPAGSGRSASSRIYHSTCYNGAADYLSPYAGPGGAGSIRLAAPTVQGTGKLQAVHGYQVSPSPGAGCAYLGGGWVRVEDFLHSQTLTRDANSSIGYPYRAYAPTTPPARVMVTAIGNMSVPPNPTGSFELPDVTINSSSPLSVTVQAQYVPVGTIVKLYLSSIGGADQILDTTPLTGTLASSTATATITFPTGFTRGYAQAKW